MFTWLTVNLRVELPIELPVSVQEDQHVNAPTFELRFLKLLWQQKYRIFRNKSLGLLLSRTRFLRGLLKRKASISGGLYH